MTRSGACLALFLPRAVEYARGMTEERSDEQLASAYAHGDAAAFDALYARYRAPLFGFLLKHSGRQRAEVEEVFQDSWLKVIRGIGRYDARQPFAPWLYRVARNCLVDRWRHLGAVESLHVADDDAMRGASSDGHLRPERRLQAEQLAARWSAALAALPALQREALLLKLENDFSLEEIAAIVGAPRETVKSRLRYAVNRLRELLEGVLDE